MLKWTDTTTVPNPKPSPEKKSLINHSSPLSAERIGALNALVRDLAVRAKQK